jgi:hypothetical protein
VSFLLDTNLVSEWMKPRPNRGVTEWLESVDEERVFLSAITIVELRYGVDRLPAGKRRQLLDQWLRDDLLRRFDARILPIDVAIADEGGRIMARCEAAGRRIEPSDALIAATAALNKLTLVTRNVADFEASLNTILNPWD